jgi:HPt (histidine-containing phosphotransfer) domain-containing protein
LANASPAIRATVTKFVHNLPTRFEQVRAAAAAGDLATVAQFAHWLKGAGGTVGYAAFSDPAGALEAQAKRGNIDAIGPGIATLAALATRLVAPDDVASDAVPVTTAALPSALDRAAVICAVAESTEPVHCRLPLANPRIRATVERFLLRLTERLADLETAVAARDTLQIAELATWLKGAGGSVGFDHFTAPATLLAEAAAAQDVAALDGRLAQIKDIFTRIELPPVAGDAAPVAPSRQAAG